MAGIFRGFQQKRVKFEIQQNLAASIEKYRVQKVNELYPATKTGDHYTQKTS